MAHDPPRPPFDDPDPAGDARRRRHEERERVREDRARAREARRRERARRKEHVLHTRISDALAEDIRRLAEDLRVPASNLVRNVLEEAFSVASRVGEDVSDLLDEALERAGRASDRMERRRARDAEGPPAAGEPDAPEPPRTETGPGGPAEDAAVLARAFPGVVAWQPVVLNAPGRCARTGRRLAPGDRAWLGVTAQGPARLLLADDVLAG